jgi:hypothetical protein
MRNYYDRKTLQSGTNVIALSKVDPAVQQVYKDALLAVSNNPEEALEFMTGIQEALKVSVEMEKELGRD